MNKQEILARLENVKKNTKQFNGLNIYYKVSDALMDCIIQSLTQEVSPNAEEVLRKCIYDYIRPQYPSDERCEQVVSMYLAIKEEKNAIIQAMQEYATQSNAEAIREHAIGFYLFCDANGWKWNQETLDFERFDGLQLLEANADDLFSHYLDIQNEKNDND